jgi:hypothetical protein
VSLVDLEGKDGVLKVDIHFKAAPGVEAAVTRILNAIAEALARFSADIKVEPPK